MFKNSLAAITAVLDRSNPTESNPTLLNSTTSYLRQKPKVIDYITSKKIHNHIPETLSMCYPRPKPGTNAVFVLGVNACRVLSSCTNTGLLHPLSNICPTFNPPFPLHNDSQSINQAKCVFLVYMSYHILFFWEKL